MRRIIISTFLVTAGVLVFMMVRMSDPSNSVPRPSPVKSQQKNTLLQSEGVIAENLEIPWDIAFLPDGEMLVSERKGRLVHIDKSGGKRTIPVTGVKHRGEGGLLGVVLHPRFAENQFLYLYLSTPGKGGATVNRIERYRLEDRALRDKKIIVENIPGAIYHDGGRMEFGPDGMLYVTTGDATSPQLAQDLKSLAGKILRLRDDGSIPNDNPFHTAVYSYGHRNPQGLAWDNEGRLWSTEHGRSGVASGLDEINLITPGKNYGWPVIEGDKKKQGMEEPALHSGARTTWAPASLAYHDGRLFFGGLRGEALYEAVLDRGKIAGLKTHLKGKYGRIRTVRVGPHAMLYITTSNRDGRGIPSSQDDRVIRINPASLK